MLNFAVGYRLPQYEKTAYGETLDYENEPFPKIGGKHNRGHKYGTELRKMLKMNRTNEASLEDEFWKLLEFTLINMKNNDGSRKRRKSRHGSEMPLKRAPRDGVSWNKMRNTLAKYRTYKSVEGSAVGQLVNGSENQVEWKSSKIKRYSRKRHGDIASVLCQLVEFYEANGTHKQKNLIRSFLEDNP